MPRTHGLVVQFRHVQRHAFAGAAFRGVFAIDLHPAHVPGQTGGQQVQLIAGADPAMRWNAGDDRARAADGERILHPHPKRPVAGPVAARIHRLVQRVKKAVETFAGDVGDRADGRVGQKRVGQQPAQILDHEIPAGPRPPGRFSSAPPARGAGPSA